MAGGLRCFCILGALLPHDTGPLSSLTLATVDSSLGGMSLVLFILPTGERLPRVSGPKLGLLVLSQGRLVARVPLKPERCSLQRDHVLGVDPTSNIGSNLVISAFQDNSIYQEDLMFPNNKLPHCHFPWIDKQRLFTDSRPAHREQAENSVLF